VPKIFSSSPTLVTVMEVFLGFALLSLGFTKVFFAGVFQTTALGARAALLRSSQSRHNRGNQIIPRVAVFQR